MMWLNEKKLDRLRGVNTEQAYTFFCTVVINIYGVTVHDLQNRVLSFLPYFPLKHQQTVQKGVHEYACQTELGSRPGLIIVMVVGLYFCIRCNYQQLISVPKGLFPSYPGRVIFCHSTKKFLSAITKSSVLH